MLYSVGKLIRVMIELHPWNFQTTSSTVSVSLFLKFLVNCADTRSNLYCRRPDDQFLLSNIL